MRTAKNKDKIERLYYRPEKRRCPYCQWKLKRQHTLWHKYLSTLKGQFHIFSQGYGCPNPACPEPEMTYRSAEAETLSVPDCSYGLDVIIEVGYQRFWHHRTVGEIHQSLKAGVAISERQVLNLLANFLALLRAGQGAKIAQLRDKWQALGGLVLSIDGLKPEKGSPALYVVRETQLGITLKAEVLTSGAHQTIATELLEPIKRWRLPIKGLISDAQESIRLAVAQVYPGQAHQTCQFHCLREAGRPIYEADRAMKTQLKKGLRHRLSYAGRLIKGLPTDDPYRPVLLKYLGYLRFSLLARGLPPFELGGLRMMNQLAVLEASLERARKKGGIGSWSV